MSTIFVLLLFVSVIAWVVGAIKPEWVKLSNRKQVSMWFGGLAIVFFILTGVTADKQPAASTTPTETSTPPTTQTARAPQQAETPKPVESVVTKTEEAKPAAAPSNADAQKKLTDFMAKAKEATLVTSYEFSDKATVVYVGPIWYTQTATQKKDFMAYVANLKKDVTGYRHFEIHDAYSDEKVAEVTSFSGALKVYK